MNYKDIKINISDGLWAGRATFVVFLISILTACGQGAGPQTAAPEASDKLSIYSVNYPLAYFAERIGGEHVAVSFPAPGGVDPAFWQPLAEDILAYQAADLILLNGAGYAGWLARASLPPSRLVDTSAGFQDMFIDVSGSTRHKHGPEGDHSHGEIAFTLWLDADLAALQAEAIQQAMVKARPELAAEFVEGYDGLISELETLDKAAAVAFANLDGAGIVYSHPVYQYMQRKYGIAGHSVFWEPGELIPANDLQKLEQLAAVDTGRPKVVIWEAEPLSANRAALIAQGYQSVVFNPFGNRPDSGDYLAGMDANIEQLRTIGKNNSND